VVDWQEQVQWEELWRLVVLGVGGEEGGDGLGIVLGFVGGVSWRSQVL
jgi:hypothetical protein